jgi:hypothetical protein
MTTTMTTAMTTTMTTTMTTMTAGRRRRVSAERSSDALGERHRRPVAEPLVGAGDVRERVAYVAHSLGFV